MTTNNNLEAKLGSRPNTVVDEKKVDEKKISVCIIDGENILYRLTDKRVGENLVLNTIKRLGGRFDRVVFVFKRSFNALGNVFNKELDNVEYVRLIPINKETKMNSSKKSFDDAFILCLAAKLEQLQFDVTIYSNDKFESNRYGNNGVVYGGDAQIRYFSKDKISTAAYVGYSNVFSPKNELTLEILLTGMMKVTCFDKIVK